MRGYSSVLVLDFGRGGKYKSRPLGGLWGRVTPFVLLVRVQCAVAELLLGARGVHSVRIN